MNDEQLNALFEKHADQAQPSPEAKQRAIQAAMAEFDLQKTARVKKNPLWFQGILDKLRLSVNNTTQETNDMNTSIKPWAFGGLTTAAVALFAVLLVNFQDDTRLGTENKVADHQPEPVPEVAQLDDALAAEAGVEAEAIAAFDVSGAESSVSDKKVLKQRAEESVSQLASIPQAAPQPMLAKSRVAATLADTIQREPVAPLPVGQNRDQFETVDTNPLKRASERPVSTFSIDVDTASYSFVRSALNRGVLPPKDAVRIEELLNYFDYQYPLPVSKSQPFKPTVSVVDSPWAEGKKLMHIGIKGFDLVEAEQKRSNLVFLLDVSGSMSQPDKLPLVKQSMNLLLSKLRPDDTVAIAVYAGAAGTVLEPTQVKEKEKIIAALSRLNAGGSTAGAQGIKLAYQLAEANFNKQAVNRVILATDGDFNVGITDREALKGYIERQRDKGIFLSVLGFGHGNYNDHLMQVLAQNGNGVAAYIDSLSEAQKVLVDESTSTLFPIAKDVKIQVEFNPAAVSEYRLIGYETRVLKREDFNNDKVDAGDIGAGHTVTAIYEFTPVGSDAAAIDDLRYGAANKNSKKPSMPVSTSEYAFLKLRYKRPDESESQLLTHAVAAQNTDWQQASLLKQEVQFSLAVAGFAQLLKDPKYMNNWAFDEALELALANRGDDAYGYRAEFVQLIRKAQVAQGL